MINFLGRGSAFADEHNSAFFVDGTDMVLLDCPMDAYRKLKKMDLSGIEHIYILLTHTHGDHISGVGMMIDYEVFIGRIPVTVVAPSTEVRDDLEFVISKIEGCSDDWYGLVVASELKKDFLISAIPTRHTESLEGRCFGYHVVSEGRDIIYTGDSATLDPFLPYVKDDSILCTETSAFKSGVHLYAGDIKEKIAELTSKGTTVYLMHLDDEDAIWDMLKDTGAELAPLFTGNKVVARDSK